MLQEDYFGAMKPVMTSPLRSKPRSVVRARPASVVRRAAARSFIKVKASVSQAVRAGTMSADQARAVLNKAGKIVSATGAPVYVRSAKVQKTLSAAGPQAPGADPATALVKAPTLYTSRLSEEEEDLLREDSPEIQEKFRLAIEKLKRGVSKRGRTMMGFDEFGANNDDVVEAWASGEWAQSGSMRTDGMDLYSYALKIGTTKNGSKVAIDYTGPYKVSNTTGTHVGKAKRVADRVEPPPELMEAFGSSRPSRYIPSERNALWWDRRGMDPPWETGFGDDIVPHLCETQWDESDARCIQHLGDPTFGANLLAEEAELWDESYVDQFGYDKAYYYAKGRAFAQWYRGRRHGTRRPHDASRYTGWRRKAFIQGYLSVIPLREGFVGTFGYDDATQWEYDKQHGGTRWGPRSMGGGYGTF